MANAPHPIERTLRASSALRISLDEFLDSPTAAREADLIGRVHDYRRAVEAGVLALPRVINRQQRTG